MTFWTRFKDNAAIGWSAFRRSNPWWITVALVFALPIAPLFWAISALFDKDSS